RLPRRRRLNEDNGALRRVDLLAVQREGGASLHDDVQLLVLVRARAELVVLADDVLSGLRLVGRACAEGAYVERAAEADVHPVAVVRVCFLGKRENSVSGLCGCHGGLLEGRVWSAASRRCAVRSA